MKVDTCYFSPSEPSGNVLLGGPMCLRKPSPGDCASVMSRTRLRTCPGASLFDVLTGQGLHSLVDAKALADDPGDGMNHGARIGGLPDLPAHDRAPGTTIHCAFDHL